MSDDQQTPDLLTRIERDILRVLKKKADESSMTLPIDYPPRQGKIPGGKAVAMLNLLFRGLVRCFPNEGFTITKVGMDKLKNPDLPPKTYDLSNSQKIVLKLLAQKSRSSDNATHFDAQTGKWFVGGATSSALARLGLCKSSDKLPRTYSITSIGREVLSTFPNVKLPTKKTKAS